MTRTEIKKIIESFSFKVWYETKNNMRFCKEFSLGRKIFVNVSEKYIYITFENNNHWIDTSKFFEICKIKDTTLSRLLQATNKFIFNYQKLF